MCYDFELYLCDLIMDMHAIFLYDCNCGFYFYFAIFPLILPFAFPANFITVPWFTYLGALGQEGWVIGEPHISKEKGNMEHHKATWHEHGNKHMQKKKGKWNVIWQPSRLVESIEMMDN